MSKQHRIEQHGKKYVTKFGTTCGGCAFLGGICPRDEISESRFCGAFDNKDGKSRIWVEDKPKKKVKKVKKTKDNLWVIEYYYNESEWHKCGTERTRTRARIFARTIRKKTRIRKFVPAK